MNETKRILMAKRIERAVIDTLKETSLSVKQEQGQEKTTEEEAKNDN